MPTRRALLLATLTFAGLAAGLPAHAAGSLVDVQIVDRQLGQVLPAYRHRGVPIVAGQPGHRCAVRMVNRTGARVLVVLSVDGINAIRGETAAVSQTGYVLAPYASAEITGWRKSMTEAAAFYFTSLGDSYAARSDRPDNVGVIGAAVYRERLRLEPRGWEPPGSSSSRAAPSPESQRADSIGKLAQRAERLGTGHGEREHAPITHTAFERAGSEPNEIVRVRYDSHANLVAMGVIRAPEPAGEPQPFARFVPDPR